MTTTRYPWLTVRNDAVEIDIQVVPRSSRNRIAGVQGDRLKIQLNAPPVDGQANKALIQLVAARLGVKKSAVAIASGETGRRKRLRIDGVSESGAHALVPPQED